MSVQADLVTALQETLAALQGMQTKARVRTPAGARRFGQPIGSVIAPDAPTAPVRRYVSSFDAGDNRDLDYAMREPNPPAKLYHAAPRALRKKITKEGLSGYEPTNTGLGASDGVNSTDKYEDEWLWTTGEDGEPFKYEYRPYGVYMFGSLGRAREYADSMGNMDVYEIDTESIGNEVIRDPSVALNWDYTDDDNLAWVTREVPPGAARRVPPSERPEETGIQGVWIDYTQEEQKDYVRTPQGAAHYGQPIGSRIVRDQRSMYTGIFDRVKHAGATVRLTDLGEPTTGFVIAERGKNQEIPEAVFFDRARGKALLHAYVREHAEELSQPDRALGLWHDEENGEVVLDTVFVVGDREQAIFAGQQNNQQAIYDVEAGDVIATGGSGDRAAAKSFPVGSGVLPLALQTPLHTTGADAVGAVTATTGAVPATDGVSLAPRRVLRPRHSVKVLQSDAVTDEAQVVDIPVVGDGAVGFGPDPSVDLDALASFDGEAGVPVGFQPAGPEQARTKVRIRKGHRPLRGVRVEPIDGRDGDQSSPGVAFAHGATLAESGGTGEDFATVERDRNADLAGADRKSAEAGQGHDAEGSRRVAGPDPRRDGGGARSLKHGRKGDPLYEALYHPGKLGMGTWKNREEFARVLDRFLRDPAGSQDEPWRDRRRRVWNPVIDGGAKPKPQGFNEGPPLYSIWEPVTIGGHESSNWKPSGKTEPIKYVYRSMTDAEFLQAVDRGYIQSDSHGCIIPDWEGTNAAVIRDSAVAYLPNSDIGRIVKIKVDPKDGWFTSDADNYLRTRERVPMSAVVAATPPIYTDDHGSPITKEWVDRNGWQYPSRVRGKARHVRDASFWGAPEGTLLPLAQKPGAHVRTGGMHAHKPRPSKFRELLRAREFYGAVTASGKVDEELVRRRIAAMQPDDLMSLIQQIERMRYSSDDQRTFSHRYRNAQDILYTMSGKSIEPTETKVRRVATPAGVRYFGLPIGSVIGFTGTRNGMTKEQRDKVGQIIKGVRPKTVHHGDAIGADTDFHKIARRLKLRTHKHPSNLPDAVQGHNTADIASKPKPPLERNKDIVARSAVVIATPSSTTEERRSGTWATVRQARRTKTPLIIVFPDGTVKRENFKTTKTPTPVAAPTPVAVPNAPTPATQGGSLTYGKPHKNFPKGFERISTPSGEWYHIGNAGSPQKPNWRVYLHDDYSRRGIVSTRNKDRLDAIQWIRNKHRNDVVVSRRAKPSRSPEDDAQYQHREKVSKALSKELTRIHEIPGNRPDTAEWHVVEDHVVTDSYQGYREVITAIKKAIRFHIRQGSNAKLTPNQRTHHRWLAHEVTKTRTLKRPRVKPGTGILSPAGVMIPKAYEPEEFTEDYTEVEGTLYDLLKRLHGLHNKGPLKHKAPPLTEFNARKRAIDLIEVDDVLDSMSPLGRWAKTGKTSVKGQYDKQDVLRNIHSIVLRRRKAGYDTEEAEQLHAWMKKRIRPKITQIQTQQVPRQHVWRQSQHPGHPAGEYIRDTPMYDAFGNEIWVSDITYDDPSNPGKVVNLKFIKTKHPDGTYSIQYPGGHTETYKDQRTANFAANQWLKKNTPLVSLEGKALIDIAVNDIMAAIELKVRHVVDADYWGLPVGTPITEHLYRAHPRLRTAHMRVRNAPTRRAAPKADVLTQQPSKYEDYEHYQGPDGRDYYVGEADDGFWVATDGDNLDLWPATGSTKSEVLRELRAYVGRQSKPTPAPAPAPAPAPQKATHKPLKPRTAKKPPAKAPRKPTAAAKPSRTPRATLKPSKPVTGRTAPSPKKTAPKVKVPMLTITKKGGAEEVVRKETLRTKKDGTVTGQPRMVFTVKQQGHEWVALHGKVVAHRSPTRTGVMIAIERHGMVDTPDSAATAGWKERGTTAKSIAAWRSKWGGGDPMIEGQFTTAQAHGKPIPGYHYATYEERREWVGPARFNVWIRDAGWESKPDRDSKPVAYSFDGRSKQRIYTPEHTEQASHEKQARNQGFDEATDKKIDAYLSKNWRKSPVDACFLLIWRQGMRPSKEGNVIGKGRTYGATTLQRRHVFLDEVQDHVILRFKGKSYKNVTLDVDDPDLVKMFRARCKGPDLKHPDDAFLDPDKDKAGITKSKSDMTPLFPGVTPNSIQSELRSITGKPFLVKDLRTRIANMMAMKYWKTHAAPKTEGQYKAMLNEIAQLVADELGNQPSMARKSYIDMPRIFKSWQQPGWSDPK